MNQAFEPACTPIAPPWEATQVIPAQLRRVNNLIFRKIGQIARTNGVESRDDLRQLFRLDPELVVTNKPEVAVSILAGLGQWDESSKEG